VPKPTTNTHLCNNDTDGERACFAAGATVPPAAIPACTQRWWNPGGIYP
jgi:hypothetical protein